MNLIGHPHRCQVPRAVLQRQLLRVPPVGLDPIARLSRNQRRRRDDAAMPEIGELAIDAISASAGFIAEFEPTAVLLNRLASLATSSGVLEIVPMQRTAPPRPSSAAVIDSVALRTSRPT